MRRVVWRPSFECELAVVSNADSGTGSNLSLIAGSQMPSPRISERPLQTEPTITGALDDLRVHLNQKLEAQVSPQMTHNSLGDRVEIWDVRRQHIAKWVVSGSAAEGGITGV